MTPLLDAEGSTPSVFGELDGVLMVIPQTLKPTVPSITTWNLAALRRVTWYSVKVVAPLVWTSRGAARLPSYASSSSHHVDVLPATTSPPRPSMAPRPTTAVFATRTALMSALQEPLPVLFPPQALAF